MYNLLCDDALGAQQANYHPALNQKMQFNNFTIMNTFLKLFVLSHALAVTVYAQNATGLKFLDDDDYERIPLASPPLRGTLPKKVDLRRYFPRPGNQGRQPSCVGWASAYALKSYQEAVERKWRPDSRDRIFSPAFVYNQIKLPGGGAYIKDAVDILIRQGALSMADFPYDESDDSRTPTAAQRKKAGPFRAASGRRVDSTNQQELLDQCKGHLASKYPVIIGATVGDSFQAHQGRRNFRLPPGPVRGGGHAMAAIGYDDEKNAMLVINSWGPGWGDGGYGWIEYDTFSRMVKRAYVVQDIVIPNLEDNNDIDDITDITDDPPPVPKSPTARLGNPTVQLGHPTFAPNGARVPGLRITPAGTVSNAKGRMGQVIIRFTNPQGNPLIANPAEMAFRDVNGLVAVGSNIFPIAADQFNLAAATFVIPEYALNFPPTNYNRSYNVGAVLSIYVDGFEVSRSPATRFPFRY